MIMINMENREIEKIALEIYPEHKDLPENDITRYFPQYRYGFIQGYIKALEQNKALLDEIEMLKFQLKAADSVNEQKDKEIKNLLLNLTNQNKQ